MTVGRPGGNKNTEPIVPSTEGVSGGVGVEAADRGESEWGLGVVLDPVGQAEREEIDVSKEDDQGTRAK